MPNWYEEHRHFGIEVLAVGKENKYWGCKMGLESGDYLAKANVRLILGHGRAEAVSKLERVRSGGNLLNPWGPRGPRNDPGLGPNGTVKFRITAREAEQKKGVQKAGQLSLWEGGCRILLGFKEKRGI